MQNAGKDGLFIRLGRVVAGVLLVGVQETRHRAESPSPLISSYIYTVISARNITYQVPGTRYLVRIQGVQQINFSQPSSTAPPAQSTLHNTHTHNMSNTAGPIGPTHLEGNTRMICAPPWLRRLDALRIPPRSFILLFCRGYSAMWSLILRHKT